MPGAAVRARRVSIPLLIIVIVCALVAAGCSSGSTGTTTTSPTKASDAYATSVCGAISTWESQVKSIATSLSSNLSIAAIKSEVGQVEAATKTLLTQIKAVPPPNTAQGTAAKQQFEQLSSDVTGTVNATKSAVAGLGSSPSKQDIVLTVSLLTPQYVNLRSTVKSSISTVTGAGGTLATSFQSSSACKGIV